VEEPLQQRVGRDFPARVNHVSHGLVVLLVAVVLLNFERRLLASTLLGAYILVAGLALALCAGRRYRAGRAMPLLIYPIAIFLFVWFY
jgi:hypothetical protein